MTLWLTTQARTLGAAAAFVLLLGLPGSASAEPGRQGDAAAEAKHKKAPKKKRTTAQVKKKGHDDKAKGHDKNKGSDDKSKDHKGSHVGKKHGKTAQAHTQPTRRDAPHQGADKKDDGDDKDGCVRDAVEIGRTSGEEMKFSLTRCKGKPAEKAVERLSVMMRPYSVAKPGQLPELHPKAGAKNLREGEISPGIHAADPGLLSRLQAIASEFPGKKLTIVSGYRVGSSGAFHHHGKALDLQVEGASASELATFCRGLVDTGCGFYPNGGFVHVDVRPKGTGHVYWIDAAGPGEAPHVVSSWPPPKDKDEKEDARPAKHAPQDDTNHADTKKKAGHGAAKTDRDQED